jgi:hypothetical protein
VIPAAGFIKAQAYVPLNHSRWVYSPLSSPQCVPMNFCLSSAHFIDPFLRAILESSFTQDDNDIFLSNLVDTPSLVLHGWVWHVVLLKSPSHPLQLYRRECAYLALERISKCLEDMDSRSNCKVRSFSLTLASSVCFITSVHLAITRSQVEDTGIRQSSKIHK